MPIGVITPGRRRVTSVDLPPGTVLCLYTDGLVERRDRPIDEGITRLAGSLSAEDPELACASAMARMADYIPHRDDVALLILRAYPGSAFRPTAVPGRP
jgi:serine phosphatase RsbU (regulator of sigma subunit)